MKFHIDIPDYYIFENISAESFIRGSCQCHYELTVCVHIHTRTDTHTVLPAVTPWDHNVCDGVSQPRVTSFNAAALFSPLLMSGCDS